MGVVKTIVKIALGLVLGAVVLIVGCVALVGVGVDSAQKTSDRTAITPKQYRSVNKRDTRKSVVRQFGDPQSADEIDQDLPKSARQFIKKGEEDLACVYYGRKGKLASIYQFCFDGNGKYQSKSGF